MPLLQQLLQLCLHRLQLLLQPSNPSTLPLHNLLLCRQLLLLHLHLLLLLGRQRPLFCQLLCQAAHGCGLAVGVCSTALQQLQPHIRVRAFLQ